MNTWLKLGAWGLVALVVFWIVLQIVSIVLGFISWLIGMLVTLAIVALLLGAAYFVLKSVLGGSGSSGRSRSGERERIFE